MGRSYTPKYRVDVEATANLTPFAWVAKSYGRANAANLAAFVESYNASFEPDGVNAHCGPLRITGAKLVRQEDGELVASWS